MASEDWFHDTEIYDFIGEHLFWIKHEDGRAGKGLSVRLYAKALEAKEAGEDWREYILTQYVSGPDLDLLVIEADPYFVLLDIQYMMLRIGSVNHVLS